MASELIIPLLPSFLDKYILATSLLRFNAWCIVHNFLEYLSDEVAQVFFPVFIFPPFNSVSSIFLTHLWYSVLNFPSVSKLWRKTVLQLYFMSLVLLLLSIALQSSFHCVLVLACWHFALVENVPVVKIWLAQANNHPLKDHNKKLFCMLHNLPCKDSTSFPWMCYFIYFVDNVRNFQRRWKAIF